MADEALSDYACFFEFHPGTLATNPLPEDYDGVYIQIRLWTPEDSAATSVVYNLPDAATGERGLISEVKSHLSELGVAEESQEYEVCLREEARREEGPIWEVARNLTLLNVPEGCHARLIALLLRQIGEYNETFPVTVVVHVIGDEPDDDDDEEGEEEEEAVRRSMEEYAAQTVPASEAAIASLEKIREGDEDELALFCVICLGGGDGEELGFLRMPCKHVFHAACVETWLSVSSSCPLCRYIMLS